MSKKKATMTLKDFHGGSIPSDLPLPSAPGVIVRPSDRVGYDRQGAWGNPIGRTDHRLRPGSAGSARNFDDKTPLFGNSAHIGRNFDEDERKPLDGATGPRRTVSDDSFRALPALLEPKMDYSSSGRVRSQPASTPGTQLSSGGVNTSYASRFAETSNVERNSQSFSNHSSFSSSGRSPVRSTNQSIGQAIGGSYSNAWGLTKDAASVAEMVPAAWSAPDAATKLAHASALEKVSSGRWLSKQSIYPQHTDIEVIRHPEKQLEFDSRGHNLDDKDTNNRVVVVGGRENLDAALSKHTEKSLVIDGGTQGHGKDLLVYDRSRSPMHTKTNQRSYSIPSDGVHHPRHAGKFGGSESSLPAPSEASERRKLNLLPRSKPMDSSEPVDYKQAHHGFQQPGDLGQGDSYVESHGNANATKPGLAGSENVERLVERPKLNLKPRSQTFERLEGSMERERNILFGGARPREMVLKERGIDDVAVNNNEVRQPPSRVKQDVPKTEAGPYATPRHSERAGPIDHQVGKHSDKLDRRVDVQRTDVQRKNGRSDNRRNSREIEQQQQLAQERQPSPETWRKPIGQPRPASVDAPGHRYGKTTSAVELAQAFSRSISDPLTADRFSGQRSFPPHSQMPFSRLTDSNPRPHINGY